MFKAEDHYYIEKMDALDKILPLPIQETMVVIAHKMQLFCLLSGFTVIHALETEANTFFETLGLKHGTLTGLYWESNAIYSVLAVSFL